MDSNDDEHGVVPQEVERVLQQVSDMIATDIQRSIDFYIATAARPSVERIILSGGSARLASLARAIEMRTGVAVEIMNPFRQIDTRVKGINPQFLTAAAPLAPVAVGLALRTTNE